MGEPPPPPARAPRPAAGRAGAVAPRASLRPARSLPGQARLRAGSPGGGRGRLAGAESGSARGFFSPFSQHTGNNRASGDGARPMGRLRAAARGRAGGRAAGRCARRGRGGRGRGRRVRACPPACGGPEACARRATAAETPTRRPESRGALLGSCRASRVRLAAHTVPSWPAAPGRPGSGREPTFWGVGGPESLPGISGVPWSLQRQNRASGILGSPRARAWPPPGNLLSGAGHGGSS